jgi:predicted DNA-binding transcriptional regulator YafY
LRVRAARVLDMLLVLQRRGRSTAQELAETLEVSERTILRDVEALSEAGVPIFTARGAGGGIELMDGFQTHLTGLTTDEARCLFLVGQPQVAHRLGLGAPTRTARNKLLHAIAAAFAADAVGLSTWFLHDPDPWPGNHIPHGELRRVARCVHQHREVQLTIAPETSVTVRPLGIVLKGRLVAVGLRPRHRRRRRVHRSTARDPADQPALRATRRLRSRRVLETAPHDLNVANDTM